LWLGDAHRFAPHLRQVVHKMAVQIATKRASGTHVTAPVRPEFAESPRAARAAGIIGMEVFTGKTILASVNEPKKSGHGVRKARAEVAAYADCTESQMMAMFGWTDPKMPAHYIAQANREKFGIRGMEKIVATTPCTS
jgi:hypothetical protein